MNNHILKLLEEYSFSNQPVIIYGSLKRLDRMATQSICNVEAIDFGLRRFGPPNFPYDNFQYLSDE